MAATVARLAVESGLGEVRPAAIGDAFVSQGREVGDDLGGCRGVVCADARDLVASQLAATDDHEREPVGDEPFELHLAAAAAQQHTPVGAKQPVHAVAVDVATSVRAARAGEQYEVEPSGFGFSLDAEEEWQVEVACVHREDRLKGVDADEGVAPAGENASCRVRHIAEPFHRLPPPAVVSPRRSGGTSRPGG